MYLLLFQAGRQLHAFQDEQQGPTTPSHFKTSSNGPLLPVTSRLAANDPPLPVTSWSTTPSHFKTSSNGPPLPVTSRLAANDPPLPVTSWSTTPSHFKTSSNDPLLTVTSRLAVMQSTVATSFISGVDRVMAHLKNTFHSHQNTRHCYENRHKAAKQYPADNCGSNHCHTRYSLPH